jgi:GNAT superfamily N-acetyltransferase
MINIRPATPDDPPILSAIAFRSKAHWGYDAVFMDACRDDLTITAGDLLTRIVFVAERDGRIVGFGSLKCDPPTAQLVDLFVDPHAIGGGVGRQLWQHAVVTARKQGCDELLIDSDPHAEGFYRVMGAELIGTTRSTVFPDRELPLLRYDLRKGERP